MAAHATNGTVWDQKSRLTLLLASAITLLALSSAAPAQQPTNLFGPPDLNAPEQVSPLGIRYRAFGFDNLGAKRINKKLVNQLRAKGVPEATVAEIQAYGQSFIGNPGHIGSLIDAAYTERRNAFLACGAGSWQYRAAQTASPDSFVVTIEPTLIWWAPENTWTIDVSTANELRAVVVYIQGLMTDPQHASYVARLEGTLSWGLGNVIAAKGGYNARSVAEEIGSQNPCGR